MRHTFFQIGSVIFHIVTQGQDIVTIEYRFSGTGEILRKVEYMRFYDEPASY
jgi:hypothetical protein